MRFPIIIAHGQDALLLANGIVATAIAMSVASLIFAARKKEEAISRGALVCSVIALAFAARELSWGFSDGFTMMAAARVVPIPLSLIGASIALRRKKA